MTSQSKANMIDPVVCWQDWHKLLKCPWDRLWFYVLWIIPYHQLWWECTDHRQLKRRSLSAGQTTFTGSSNSSSIQSIQVIEQCIKECSPRKWMTYAPIIMSTAQYRGHDLCYSAKKNCVVDLTRTFDSACHRSCGRLWPSTDAHQFISIVKQFHNGM